MQSLQMGNLSHHRHHHHAMFNILHSASHNVQCTNYHIYLLIVILASVLVTGLKKVRFDQPRHDSAFRHVQVLFVSIYGKA